MKWNPPTVEMPKGGSQSVVGCAALHPPYVNVIARSMATKQSQGRVNKKGVAIASLAMTANYRNS